MKHYDQLVIIDSVKSRHPPDMALNMLKGMSITPYPTVKFMCLEPIKSIQKYPSHLNIEIIKYMNRSSTLQFFLPITRLITLVSYVGSELMHGS